MKSARGVTYRRLHPARGFHLYDGKGQKEVYLQATAALED